MRRPVALLSLSLLAYAGVPSQAQPPAPAAPPAAGFSFPFPVHSPTLRAARKTIRQRHAVLDRPLFLLGDDAVSRRWLSRQAEQLRRLDAVGLVVEVASQARFDALRRLAPGLELTPVVGDALAEHFGFSSYPALLLPAEQKP